MKVTKGFVFDTSGHEYLVMEEIGFGGSGHIYKVKDESGNFFAIKILDPGKASKDKIRRFKNELHFCQANKHPNIISIIDDGFIKTKESGEKLPFYVMPLYSCSLRKLIKQNINKNKIMEFYSNLLDGIEAAHLKNVIHRDIKPENILYDEKNDFLLVADFGIAHFEEDDLYTAIKTQDKDRLANFQYAAPEQKIPGQIVDSRADIYALGYILNELFTGKVPLGSGYKKIKDVAADYEYLDDLVDIMIRQNPDDRPPNIDNIKLRLISQKNKFISTQKLNKLKGEVIKEEEIDDPIILDPIRVVDFDWNSTGWLKIILNQSVNPMWQTALLNIGSYRHIIGKEPEVFRFDKNAAFIQAQENEVQQVIDFFKSWLPKANQRYKEMSEQKRREAFDQRAREQQIKIKAEEARRRVLSSVKI
jgi:serine/threonine protein kinase